MLSKGIRTSSLKNAVQCEQLSLTFQSCINQKQMESSAQGGKYIVHFFKAVSLGTWNEII